MEVFVPMSKDRPIIFSTPMIRALLDDRKTQTRRLISSPLAKAEIGDRLWVRETHYRWAGSGTDKSVIYCADGAWIDWGMEPLWYGRAWRNARTPRSSTLAHEIALRSAGQYAFDTRQIPQTQFVLGGFYTVRGYPQATIASDSAVLLSAEYRYHLARALRPEAPRVLPIVGTFRVAPARVYGRPDWDLVFRAFTDWGRAIFSEAVAGELDETLSSVGVGLELVLKRNLSLRVDYGIALSDVRAVESGDSETNFVATFRY